MLLDGCGALGSEAKFVSIKSSTAMGRAVNLLLPPDRMRKCEGFPRYVCLLPPKGGATPQEVISTRSRYFVQAKDSCEGDERAFIECILRILRCEYASLPDLFSTFQCV